MKKIILSLFSLCTTCLVWAHDFRSDDIYYDILDENNVEVTFPYKGYDVGDVYNSTSITIPATVTYNGTIYNVTSIGYNAFKGSPNLCSVIVGNNVKTIKERAFYDCPKLTSVTIGNNVTNIETESFNNCPKLSKTNYVGDLNGWCNIEFENYESNPIYHSKDFYINNQKITDLVITENVETIKKFVFYGSSITSLMVSTGVKNVGKQAFSNCMSLRSVIWNAKISPQEVFDGNLSSFIVGDSVKEMSSNYFNSNIVIDTLIIGRNANIDQNAIMVTVNNIVWNVKSHEDFTYKYLYGDQYDSNHPFYYIREVVKSITLGEDVEYIPANLCVHLKKISSVMIPKNVKSIGAGVFRECSSLSNIMIETGLVKIEDETFYNCHALSSIIIPNSVTSIGDDAFYNCNNLTSIIIPNTVTNIGKRAFCNCSSIASINMPNNITKIEESTFASCYSLTSITIPNSVTIIGNSAFYTCKSLNSVTIGTGVTSIGQYAFSNCKVLYDIYCYPKNPPTVYESSFTNYNAYLYVPCNAQRYYQADMVFSKFNIDANLANYTITISSQDDHQGVVDITEILCDEVKILATAKENYRFVKWSDGNTDNPRSITLTQDTTLIANFAKNTCEVTIVENEHGVITGSGVYNYGETVTITAIPNSGYEFLQWGNGSIENPYTFVIEQDMEFKAEFIATTAVNNIHTLRDSAHKFLRDGQLFILRDGKTYNAQGTLVGNN